MCLMVSDSGCLSNPLVFLPVHHSRVNDYKQITTLSGRQARMPSVVVVGGGGSGGVAGWLFGGRATVTTSRSAHSPMCPAVVA